MSDQFKTCLTHNHLEGENLACPACLEDIIAGKDARLTTLLAVVEQCEKALEPCVMVIRNEILVRDALGRETGVWPDVLNGCVSGNGIEQALEAIRKVKANYQQTPSNIP